MKFKYLPYIQIYRARDNDASALSNEISFPRSNKETTLVTTLVKELHQSKGDSFAYVEILMKYYQQRTVANKKEITALTQKLLAKNKTDSQADADFEETMIRDALANELDDSAIRKFAHSVDKVYEDTMMAMPSDYTVATELLIKPQVLDSFYHEFQRLFPHCSSMFHLVAASKQFKIPTVTMSTEAGSNADEENEPED